MAKNHHCFEDSMPKSQSISVLVVIFKQIVNVILEISKK